MGLMDKQRQYYDAIRTYLASMCPPTEPIVGVIVTSQSKTFSNQLYAVGVTPNWMVVQPLDKKQTPAGQPVWLGKGDIQSCTLWGSGGGLKEFLSTNSEYELRFTTPTEKYKLMALGGWTMSKIMGEDYIQGLDAVASWLASTRQG